MIGRLRKIVPARTRIWVKGTLAVEIGRAIAAGKSGRVIPAIVHLAAVEILSATWNLLRGRDPR